MSVEVDEVTLQSWPFPFVQESNGLGFSVACKDLKSREQLAENKHVKIKENRISVQYIYGLT